jgi:CTP synthase (UTP-ammonia lyase)
LLDQKSMIGGRSDVLVRIGIIGDFNSKYQTHVAINAAIEHTAAAIGEVLRAEWLPTPDLAGRGEETLLSEYHALWAAPVSPYKSAEGMLRASNSLALTMCLSPELEAVSNMLW